MKKLILMTAVMFYAALSFAQVSLTPGSVVTDFTINDNNGNAVSLLQYTKGNKVVLVDFWASWCAPCRNEGKNVKAIYADYSAKGFSVLGVSLDTKVEAWHRALGEESYPWTQISDLKGFNSPVCKQFGINAIPFLLLIDGNGKVIAVNLRGEQLRAKIAELCQ